MKILLALDDSPSSEAAIEAVVAQFAPGSHELRLFQTIDWEPHLPVSYQFAAGPHAAAHVMAARDDMVNQARDYLLRVADHLRAAGYEVTIEVNTAGSAADAILRAAEDWSADLIVVGSHGRGGIDRLLLGSVSDAVVRRAQCSVQVIRARRPATRRAVPAARIA